MPGRLSQLITVKGGMPAARRARRRARDTAKFTKETHPPFDTERLRSKVWIRIRALKRLHDLIDRNR